MTSESFFGKILPVHRTWTSFSQATKAIIFWSIAALIGYSTLSLLANRSITVLGLTTNENGVVRDGLFVILFADNVELTRTVSTKSKWDGIVPSSEDLKRGANFQLNFPNYFGYNPNPFELTVFLSANELKVNEPQFFVTPNNHLLTLLSVSPTNIKINTLKPLQLSEDGTISEIAQSDSIYAEQERILRIREMVQRGNIRPPLIVGTLAAVVVAITTNIIASFLQENYKLIKDKGRFAIVVIVFVIALLMTLLFSTNPI